MHNHLLVRVWWSSVLLRPDTVNEVFHLCQCDPTIQHGCLPFSPLLCSNKGRICSSKSRTQAGNPFGKIWNSFLPHLHQFPLAVKLIGCLDEIPPIRPQERLVHRQDNLAVASRESAQPLQPANLVQRNNQCSQPLLIHLSPHKGHLFSCVYSIGWYGIIWSTMIDVSDISCQEVT